MRTIRYFLFCGLLLALIGMAMAAHYYYKGFYKHSFPPAPRAMQNSSQELARIKQKIGQLKSFKGHPMNSIPQYTFLVDTGPSLRKEPLFRILQYNNFPKLASSDAHLFGKPKVWAEEGGGTGSKASTRWTSNWCAG